MTRRAIGIMVHQSEVKAAYLTLAKGMLSIEALETIYLKEPIDEPVHAGEVEGSEPPFEDQNQFEINDPYIEEEEELGFDVEPQDDGEDTNATVLYSLISRLTEKRVRVAFSMPPTMVRYGRHHLIDLPAKKTLARRLQDKLRPPKTESSRTVQHTEILNDDDSSLPMVSQFPPPLYDLLQEVNTFTGGKLQLRLLDTNELALVGLVRDNYRLAPEDVTAIVHIESDFSRIIFLKGRNLFRVSQMINEPFDSPDLLNIIHSKLIYEQDESEIPDLTRILISGKGASLRARDFFGRLYSEAEIGYVYSKKMGGILSEDLRGEIFSEFAVPIALAAKVLESNNSNYLSYNLLPEHILDRQKVLKLAPHGYGLLFLLALVAFGFTYKIVAVKSQIRRIGKASKLIEAQLGGYRETLERVSTLDAEIVQYDRLISLADSLGKGQEEMLSFLDELNDRLKKSQAIWISQISKRPNSLNIRGLALNRSKIPVLSSELGNADLKRVTRTNVGGSRAFAFELEKRQQQEELPLLLGEFPLRPAEEFRLAASAPPRRPPETTPPPGSRTENSLAKPERSLPPNDGADSTPNRGVATRPAAQKPAEQPAVRVRKSRSEEPPSASGSIEAEPTRPAVEKPVAEPVASKEPLQRYDPQPNPPADLDATPEPSKVETPRSAGPQKSRGLPAQPAPSRAPKSGEFTIEIGVFTTREQAVAVGRRLGDTGFALYIQKVLFPDRRRPVYRLVLGAFSTRRTAVRAASVLAPRLPRGARILQIP